MVNDILYITESSGYGGAEQYLVYLAEGVKEHSDICVALPFKKCNEKFRTVLGNAGVRTINLPQFMAIYPVNFLVAVLFLMRHRSALIHFSLPYPDSCRWILLAAALFRRRYVITEHLVPPNPFKAGAYFAITHLLFNPLKKLSYAGSLGVAAVSGGNREILVRSYGMPQSKLTVIHNGIDCSKYRHGQSGTIREQLGIPAGNLVLTSIGRLAEQKGFTFLISALKIVAEQGIPFTMVLVGDGPLREPLERQARECGLADMIRFTGFREDIPAIFAMTDIFVMASLNEGFPLTLLEAMAAGKAIVTTRVTGTSEAIVDGDNGLLCAPASAGDLAEKILTVIRDRDKRASIGARAREAAEREFDVGVMVAKTRRFYEEGMTCAGR